MNDKAVIVLVFVILFSCYIIGSKVGGFLFTKLEYSTGLLKKNNYMVDTIPLQQLKTKKKKVHHERKKNSDYRM